MYRLFSSLVLICLCACQESRLCVIEGTLPSTAYDGEQMYIVPLKNVRDDRVDSAIIENGAFRMERKVKEDELYILRTRPLLRLSLQELLIVVEPGNVIVRIDSVSSGGGTPLNEALQKWKEIKTRHDIADAILRQMLDADGDSVTVLNRMEQLKAESAAYHYNVVKDNRGNILGAFVYDYASSSFTPEQKQALKMPK